MKDNDLVEIKKDGKIKIDVSDDENITINKDQQMLVYFYGQKERL